MLGKCDLNRMHPIVRCTWKAGAEHDVHSRLHLGWGEGGADDTVTSGEGHNMTPPCLPGYSSAGKALQFHLLVFRWGQNLHPISLGSKIEIKRGHKYGRAGWTRSCFFAIPVLILVNAHANSFGKAYPVHSVDDWHIHWLTITAALGYRNE